MAELSRCSARELAERIRRGTLSSLELVDDCLARIERYNSRIQALVTLDVEGARAAAKRADEQLASGQRLGPLHGVPMTVKDSFEVADMRTTCGVNSLRDHVPARDAVAVQRLRSAGAIILGKSNTPPFCGDAQTHNAIFGVTNNPWDLARTPGGSSGGSAAALAAGLVPLELGSDIAGSIRLPASFCGVFGHKPTYGIVPTLGHIPGPPGSLAPPDLAVAGPMARSADDLWLMLDVLAGPLPEQAKAYRLQLPAARAHSLRSYRVAAWLDDTSLPVDSGVLERLQAAVTTLRAAGVQVDDARPPVELQTIWSCYRKLLDPLLAAGLGAKQLQQLEQQSTQGDPESPLTLFARNALSRHHDWLVTNEQREQLRAVWTRWFADYDVLLAPVTITPAFAHDHTRPQQLRTLTVNGRKRAYDDALGWNAVASCLYLPATSVPVGLTVEGLPVGMQIIAPYLEDHTALDFAARMSELLGGYRPPPGY